MSDISPELRLLIVAVKETLLRWRPTDNPQLSLLPAIDQLETMLTLQAEPIRRRHDPEPEPPHKDCWACGQALPKETKQGPAPIALPPAPLPVGKVKRKRTPRGKSGPRQCYQCDKPAVLGFSRCEFHRLAHLDNYHKRKIADLEQKLREQSLR